MVNMMQLFPLCFGLVVGFDVDGCTSIIVGKGATIDGSAITSHANDCEDCDWRVVYVPARDHAPGATRTIYDAVWSQYPRLVDPGRSSAYTADGEITHSTVLGTVPQVQHTFALWEASYGLMNEHGLGMGESTCQSFLIGKGTQNGGTALFTIGNLMAIALERCKTARCAIQTMGDLGSQYGFYGEEADDMDGAGEAVTVVDKEGDAWVFHIGGGLPERPGAQFAGQRGALWAAQRVPDGHVAVIANSWIIKEIDPTDTENFMMHPGLFELAQEAGLWDGKVPFVFNKLLAPDLVTFQDPPGTAPIPFYTTLRMWAVYRHAAASAKLGPSNNLFDFPFSVPVDKKVSHLDVMDWFRDHFEGTEFDMRFGALAGPWQSPNRAEGGRGQNIVPGQFARSSSIPRTSYTVLLQSGNPQPVVWYAPDASASSVFVPFFASTLSGAGGEYDFDTYGKGSMKHFTFTGGELPPAWWAFDFVANWMELSYQNMSETYIYPRVHSLQQEVAKEAALAVAMSSKTDSNASAAKLLSKTQTRLQRQVVKTWWELAAKMVVRYNDMFFNFPERAPTEVLSVGYPAFWLEMVGFNQESYRPTWMAPAARPPMLLNLQSNAALAALQPAPSAVGNDVRILVAGAFGALLLGIVVGNTIGYKHGWRDAVKSGNQQDAVYHHM